MAKGALTRGVLQHFDSLEDPRKAGMAVKGNQEGLEREIAELFDEVEGKSFADVRQKSHRTAEKGHGRSEEREYTLAQLAMTGEQQRKWPGLRCFGKVVSRRAVEGKTTEETRYYITSLPCRAKLFAESVRGHWSVENNLHWMLDVSFREDESRVRAGHGAEKLSTLRRLGLSLLKAEKTNKRGIAAKRKLAGWSNDYLLKVLEAV